jgi:hypothetical protein
MFENLNARIPVRDFEQILPQISFRAVAFSVAPSLYTSTGPVLAIGAERVEATGSESRA